MRHLVALLILPLVALLLLDGLLGAQGPTSKLKPGSMIGNPFTPIVVSGKRIQTLREALKKELDDTNKKRTDAGQAPLKDEKIKEAFQRYQEFPHSPVSEFALLPVVAVFIREDEKPDVPLTQKFLAKIDAAITRDTTGMLNSFAIVVSPSARGSATSAEKDSEALLKEAKARNHLSEQVKELAKDLKHVVVGYHPPEKLESWGLGDEPGIVVLIYSKLHVHAKHAFAEGKLTEEDMDRVLKDVDKLIKKQRKRPKRKGVR